MFYDNFFDIKVQKIASNKTNHSSRLNFIKNLKKRTFIAIYIVNLRYKNYICKNKSIIYELSSLAFSLYIQT